MLPIWENTSLKYNFCVEKIYQNSENKYEKIEIENRGEILFEKSFLSKYCMWDEAEVYD